MERGWFAITVRANSVEPAVSFPEFGSVPANAPDLGELHYALLVDGREVSVAQPALQLLGVLA